MPETLFAPAKRSEADEVGRSFIGLNAEVRFDAVLDLVPDISFIVNEDRQLLFANAAALSSLGLECSDVLGSRPGEVLGCVHSGEMPGGCGCAESCAVCGAMEAILQALDKGIKTERECRMTVDERGKPASLDLLVTAMPVATDKGSFAVVTLRDIGDTKRRQVMERIFFHDLMNSLSSLQACEFMLNNEIGPQVPERRLFERLRSATKSLIDQVCQQRELMTMESDDLRADIREVVLAQVATEAKLNVEISEYAAGKRVVLQAEENRLLVAADPVLLDRVVVNMLKNALEASLPGQAVTLTLGRRDGRAQLSVHNDTFIPREIQLQIFSRSFSTKGKGRGIGTYSMKMLTEKYLGGQIDFCSDEKTGTVFRLLLPLA